MVRANQTKLAVLFIVLFSSAFSQAKKTNVESLQIEPQVLETTFDQEHEFKVTGGQAPYTFKTSSGLIRFKNNTATYISPNQPGDATVTVKDALGETKTVKILIISNVKDSEQD